MKWDVALYVERCLTCRKVKAEHQRPHGKMQPLDIPVWKWEDTLKFPGPHVEWIRFGLLWIG